MIEIKRSVLPNGLIVLTHEMPWVHSVYLLIGVKYGSALDPIGLEGMAHFIEHTVFKGTSNRTLEQINTAIEDRGNILNACTGEHATYFNAKVIDSDIAIAWDVLADLVSNPLFPAEELETERGSIIEEIKSCEDDDNHVLWWKNCSLIFPSASFSREIVGTEETVSRITREDAMRVWQKFYQPNNMVAVAVGNISHKSNLELAEQNLGRLANQKITDNQIVQPENPTETQAIILKPKIQQAKMIIGFKTIPDGANQRDALALDLLADILGKGMTSVLITEVREKRGLVYSIGADHDQNIFSGIFTIGSQFVPKKKKQIVKLITDILANINDHITEKAFDRAIAKERTEYMFMLEKNALVADAIFDDENNGSLNQLINFPEVIGSITMDDLRRVAKEYLNPKKAFTASIEPEK